VYVGRQQTGSGVITSLTFIDNSLAKWPEIGSVDSCGL
jgi:hypothetical protein